MDLGIAGKVALITGGSRGSGLATARLFAAEGCKVAVVARGQAGIDDAVATIRADGGTAAGFAADCMTRDGIEGAIRAATETLGPPQIAIYVPSAGIHGYFDEVDDEDFLLGDKNLIRAFIWMVRAVAPGMKAAGWGRIVTVGSRSVKMIHREVPHAVPNTYRLAAIGLSKTIADDYGRYGITVNTIGTGSILTDSFRDTFAEIAARDGKSYGELEAEKAAAIPVRRLGQPADIAAACAFFASDRAGFITGETLLLDGGRAEVPL